MSNNKEKDEEKPIVAKTAVDLQRLKLMKLMKNPDKPIILPERPKPKNTPSVPEFVRNVMGSSAGAGSGEFHVYRHLRRKEYARQKFIQEKGHKELLDAEYHEKLEQNRKKAEEATAKRRAKRLKRKQRKKERKKMKGANAVENKNEENSDNDTDDSDAAEEINKNRTQSNGEDITPMEVEQSREVEDKEQMEVEDNDKECEGNNVQPDVTEDVTDPTTSTEVEPIKEKEGTEKNEIECKEEKEKSEAEHKEDHKKNEMGHEDKKKSELKHEGKKRSKAEHEKENKAESELENKESKEKGNTEHKEKGKGNDKIMVSNESVVTERKEDE